MPAAIGAALLCIAQIFLVTTSVQAQRMTLAEWYTRKTLQSAGRQFTQSYDAYRTERAKWDANIEELKEKIYRCGNCPEKAQLEGELRKWEGTKEQFLAIAQTTLKSINADNPAYVAAWSRFLNLEPRQYDPVAMGRRAEGLARLKANNAEPMCIDLYTVYAQCMVKNGESGAFCRKEDELYNLCLKGDKSALQQRMMVFERRRQGEILPDVSTNEQLRINYVNFGDVPSAFAPKVPPPDVLGDHMLQIDMDRPRDVTNLLVQVQVGRAWPRVSFDSTRQLLGTSGIFRPSEIDRWNREVMAVRGLVLVCGYQGERGMPQVFFWYSKYPEGVSVDSLRGLPRSHPLLAVGAPQSQCPLERRDALVMWERR
jgi:hypothetical protein